MSHIWQNLRLVLDPLCPKRLQRIHQHHPRTDARAEILRVERTQRHHFPPLDIPRRPIVQQHQAEQILLRLLDPHRLPHLIPLAHKRPQFELEIQPLRRREDGAGDLGRRIRHHLPVRSPDRGSRHDDRGRATVVADGQVRVVWVEGVVEAADEGAGIDGVVLTDEEVGVVADAEGEVGPDVFQQYEAALVIRFGEALRRAEFRAFCKDLLEVFTDLSMHGAPQRGEIVQGRLREDVEMRRCDGGTVREAGTGGEDGEIEGVVSDCYGDVRG